MHLCIQLLVNYECFIVNFLTNCTGNPVTRKQSESESELSSQDEFQRETVPDLKPRVKKTIKRPKIIKQNIPATKVKKMKFDEVFEDPKALEKPSKPKLTPIPFNTEKDEQVLGFGFIEPINPPKPVELKEVVDPRSVMEEERLEKEPPVDHISFEALASNRISEKGLFFGF